MLTGLFCSLDADVVATLSVVCTRARRGEIGADRPRASEGVGGLKRIAVSTPIQAVFEWDAGAQSRRRYLASDVLWRDGGQQGALLKASRKEHARIRSCET